MSIARVAFVATLALPVTAHASWFGPSTRAECLADAARSAPTHTGLRILIGDCYAKFPPDRDACQRVAADPAPTRRYDFIAGAWVAVEMPRDERQCRAAYPRLFSK